MQNKDEDELLHSFTRLGLEGRTGPWHCLGTLRHLGTGWHFRDPLQKDPAAPEITQSWDGIWVIHARHRMGSAESPDHIQLMAVWEHLPAPLDRWVAQPTLSIETGCMVLCEATRFRRDGLAHEHIAQYRGFLAAEDGDQWMLSGLRHLDASPRRIPSMSLQYTLDAHCFWIDTEQPIIVQWDVAYFHQRACAIRWALPVDGAGSRGT